MNALSVVRIEDHDGTGYCGHCGRDGIRWAVVLSDGTVVGAECAKRRLGIPVPRVSEWAWVAKYDLVAAHTDERGRQSFMYQRKGGQGTREVVDGHLVQVGGVRQDWERRGWEIGLRASKGSGS